MSGTITFKLKIGFAIAATLLLSACGQDTTNNTASAVQSKSFFQNQPSTGVNTGTNTGVNTGSGTGTSTGTGTGTGVNTGTLPPPIRYVVKVTGHDGDKSEVYIDVKVNRVLKIKITAKPTTINSTGTGYAPNCRKQAIGIGIESTEQFTALLENGDFGTPESMILDLSDAFTRSLPDDDTSDSQTVRVYFRKSNDDYFYTHFGTYGPYAATYFNQTRQFLAEIQTDFTRPVQ